MSMTCYGRLASEQRGEGREGATKAGGKIALLSHVERLSHARKSFSCTVFKGLP